MHQPDSECKIQITVDGEVVSGTVYYTGTADITVRLDCPSDERTNGVHMPYFARGVHPEGFLGKYGDHRARELLAGLYEDQKKGDRRRKFAHPDSEEFGRVRYLTVDPGYPKRGVQIREKSVLDALVYVQIEDAGPYGQARFFDSGTKHPFLLDSAVYERSIREYLNGVTADRGFSEYLETLRRKRLPEMIRHSELFRTHGVSPHQVDFLINFGCAWRAGIMPLDAPEIDRLIELGFLIRDLGFAAAERQTLEASLERSRKALKNLEAAGKVRQAAECRARVQKLERRIDLKILKITAAGKAVAQKLPSLVK